MTLVLETEARLPELIDRVLAGERVTLVRQGEPVAELVAAASRPVLDLEWLRKVRVTPTRPVDGTAMLRQMRDEGP